MVNWKSSVLMISSIKIDMITTKFDDDVEQTGLLIMDEYN